MCSDSSTDGTSMGSCDLCDRPAKQSEDVVNEETGEMATANLCEEHVDKLEAYNRGEDVEF